MKYFTFLFSAIEECAAIAGTTDRALDDQSIDIIYEVMERRGSAKCLGSVIVEEKPGLYRVDAA